MNWAKRRRSRRETLSNAAIIAIDHAEAYKDDDNDDPDATTDMERDWLDVVAALHASIAWTGFRREATRAGTSRRSWGGFTAPVRGDLVPPEAL